MMIRISLMHIFLRIILGEIQSQKKISIWRVCLVMWFVNSVRFDLNTIMTSWWVFWRLRWNSWPPGGLVSPPLVSPTQWGAVRQTLRVSSPPWWHHPAPQSVCSNKQTDCAILSSGTTLVTLRNHSKRKYERQEMYLVSNWSSVLFNSCPSC